MLVPLLVSLLACQPDACRDPGTVCTVAGVGQAGFNGDGLDATEAWLYYPFDVTAWTGTGRIVVDDWNNERVRMIDDDGKLVTVVGRDVPGDGADGGADRVAPGAPGQDVSLNHPAQAELGPDGAWYIAAWHNYKIRRWDPVEDRVLVIVGNVADDVGTGANAGFSGDGGPASDALVWFPTSIAFGPDGTFYFTDEKNLRIREVTTDGMIDTVTGCGDWGMEDGPGETATFRFLDDPKTAQPQMGGGLEYDDGYLYVADTFNHAVRRIDPATGEVSTVAGTGEAGYSGDGGDALSAQLNQPRDVEVGPDGRLYVADSFNHVIRAIDLDDGTIQTVVGTGSPGDAQEGDPADAAALNTPYGLDFADDGAMLIADTYNNKIRRVTP